MKQLLKFSVMILALSLVGCASHIQMLSGRAIYPLYSTSAISARNGKNLKIVIASPLNRVTTSGAPIALSNRYGVLKINAANRYAASNTVVVEANRLTQLNVSNFSTVTIQFNHPQSVNMSFKNIGRVLIRGRGVIPKLSVNNVNQFRINGKTDINTLQLSGAGSFRAKNLSSKQLTINKSGSSMAVIRGEVTIDHIEQTGSGSIDLFWLKSRKTTLHAIDTSVTKLAGYTKHLIVTLENSAKLKAPFLRSDTIHITTYDHAHASIYAIDHLFASAFGPSTIKYFGKPKYIYKNNGGQGIILPV